MISEPNKLAIVMASYKGSVIRNRCYNTPFLKKFWFTDFGKLPVCGSGFVNRLGERGLFPVEKYGSPTLPTLAGCHKQQSRTFTTSSLQDARNCFHLRRLGLEC
jgi:hypothetical protein